MNSDEHPHVLLVEDDQGVANSLSQCLEDHGYVVTHTPTCAAAREQLAQIDPQMFILDVRLPDGDGMELCHELRLAGYTQPALMLTVQDSEDDQVRGLQSGADDYVTKPFRVRELLARLDALLRRSYGPLARDVLKPWTVADLTIDPVRSTVVKRGTDVRVTPTEWKILTYLCRAERDVTRRELIEHIWGADSRFYEDKSVTVHVRRLRAKIEDDPSSPRIVLTVPGGYRVKHPSHPGTLA